MPPSSRYVHAMIHVPDVAPKADNLQLLYIRLASGDKQNISKARILIGLPHLISYTTHEKVTFSGTWDISAWLWVFDFFAVGAFLKGWAPLQIYYFHTQPFFLKIHRKSRIALIRSESFKKSALLKCC